MNKVFLIGNLTRDPEMSETPSGIPYCRLGLAVNRPYSGATENAQRISLISPCGERRRKIAEDTLKKAAKCRLSAAFRTVLTKIRTATRGRLPI